MKNLAHHFLKLFILVAVLSCSEEQIDSNFKNVFDCQLDSDINFIGVCLNGATAANPNETIIYASKATANFSEIQWEIESGDIEILDIDSSIDNNLPKSIVTLQFNSNFSGGSIKVTAIDANSNSVAEISNYTIALEN